MSRTLNLMELLLDSGRHLRDIGRIAEAIAILDRLADFRTLPLHIIEEVQSLLADLQMQRDNYAKARRHLTAALAIKPLNAEYHHRMGIAIEEDPQADLKRAEMYYAQAVQLDTDNATYWLDYGTYLLHIGKRQLGLQAIRKAYDRGIHDAEIVGQVAEALRQEDCFEEATSKLRAALFQNRGARFEELWRLHQFHCSREQQQEQQRQATGRQKGPVILPFTPASPTGKYADLGKKTMRIDPPESLPAPKSPMPQPFRRPPKKG